MKKYLFNLLFFLAVLVFTGWLSLRFGGISLAQNISPENIRTIMSLRLSRIILAGLAGASLSLAGLVYQSVLLNPLAEPYLLGVSAGGALGAVISLWLGGAAFFILAILGSLLALLTVYFFAARKGRFDNTGVILSGVMVNAFCSALIMLIISLAGSKVNSMMFWLMGDIGSGRLENSWLLFGLLALLLIFTLVFSRSIDALSFGDENAAYLGIEVHQLKIVLFLLSSCLTAAVVAAVGIIGFVGLIIPHIAKMLVSEHTQEALPFVLVLGAAFLITADFLSRIVIPDTILPVGIITALIGVPFFVMVYKKRVY